MPGWPIASIVALKIDTKSAPECLFECGRGGAIAIWAVPKCLRVNLFGASLNVVYFSFSEDITGQFELFGRWTIGHIGRGGDA